MALKIQKSKKLSLRSNTYNCPTSYHGRRQLPMLLLDLVLMGNPLPPATMTSKSAGWTFQPVTCSYRKGDSIMLLFSGIINLMGVVGFVLWKGKIRCVLCEKVRSTKRGGWSREIIVDTNWNKNLYSYFHFISIVWSIEKRIKTKVWCFHAANS